MLFKKFLVLLLVCAFMAGNVFACTVFKATAKDGSIVSARTMEFGYDVQSEIVIIPRGKEFVSPTPDNKAGLAWKNKYGYVAVDGYGEDVAVFDGLNEAGLAFSGLWYESDMQWQKIASGDEKRTLAHAYLGAWILGNFSTVGELKDAIKTVKVFGAVVPQMGMAPPLHFAVYDAKGGSIVVEYDYGMVNVYDNPLGVMTNAPNFPWHLTNLRTYVAMSPEQAKPQDYAGMRVKQMGHGSGMFGLPGDITPPSRFIKMAVLLKYADEVKDAKGALNLSRHVINNVDIVKGTVVDKDKDGKAVASETTEWTTFRDLTNRVFYFTTYDNLTMRKVDLKRVDFSREKTLSMSADDEVIIDLTERE
ncbi:MAG: choloylglycine hydrolase family protein [Candidatus Margulisiibacteriota bacterium]|nr:choloylglycine hydrolase family protein [Candidatus Margulisiibacteriota bacterium]